MAPALVCPPGRTLQSIAPAIVLLALGPSWGAAWACLIAALLAATAVYGAVTALLPYAAHNMNTSVQALPVLLEGVALGVVAYGLGILKC
jgi:hypothetical protein